MVVDATAPLRVDFSVGAFTLSSAFNIILIFPARYSTSQSYFPTAGSYTCAGVTANLASTPPCSATNDGSSQATVKITGIYASSIAAAATASFTITSIKNPISTATVTGITMRIVNPTSDTHEIATRSGLTMAVTTSKTVSSFTLSILSPTPPIEVLTSANARFSITPGVFVNSGCRASIQYPTDINHNTFTIAPGFVSPLTYSSGSRTLANTADGECTGTNSETGLVDVIVNLRSPPQVKASGDFQFTLTTSAGNAIATGTAAFAISNFKQGTITAFVFTHISGGSTIVQTATEWKIGFTLKYPLANPWKITVTYPNTEFTVSACNPRNGIGFITASTTCSVSGNTITIQGTYALAAGAVSMEGITGNNPTAVFNTGSFTAFSFNVIGGADYGVNQYDNTDTSFTNPFRATAQTLTSVAVSIDTPGTNSITGRTNVQYNFVVKHVSTFPTGSIIRITRPGSGCLTMYDSSGTTAVTSVTLTNVITSSKSPATDLTFSYDKFTNPRSTNSA